MKKILFALAGIMLCATAAQAAIPATFGTTQAFPITITINTDIWLEATIDPAVLGMYGVINQNLFSNGQWAPGGNPRATVANRGGVQVDLTVMATGSANLTLGNTIDVVGLNQGVLCGVWTYYNDATLDPINGTTLARGDFEQGDVILGTPTVASWTGYYIDGQATPRDGQDLPGYNVDPGASRSMRFMFQTPNAVDATVQNVGQVITVTIGAQI